MKDVTHSIIVHIDDDPDDLSMLRDVITALDSTYQIVQALDGEQGLEKLFAIKKEGILPCLIVLDVNMPRLDGRQTFVRIRADEAFRSIPVVVFSTSKSSLDKLFFEGDRVEYITKPYRLSQLKEVAKRLLQHCER